MPEIVDKQVVGIGFGFLNDEEIKKLSVKQITNGYSFDTLRQPVRGGLYDRAFGTLDIHEDCATCGLGDKYCPGHAGHLQLAVPVYNVFLFPQLYKLLQVKCMHCHKLRLGSLKKKILEAQLVYIAAGHLVKALDLEQQFLAKAARGSLGTLASAFGDDEDEASPDTQSLLDKLDVEIEKANRLLSRKRGNQLSMNDIQVRTRLIRQFMAAANVKKCAHCSAISPKFRRDGFTKIFVMSNAAAQTANTSQGIRIKSVLTEPAPADPKTAGFATGKGLEKRLESSKKAAAAESAKQKKAKAAKAAAAAKKARRGKAKKGSSDDGESGSDSESDDGGEADLSVDDASDADAEDGMVSPSSVTGKPANLVAAGVMSDAVAVAETNDSRIMLPNEVERHMQCLWSEEHELLSRLFFAEAKYQVAVPAYNAADYRAFFHRVLIVPPSRLRPPRFVGGEAFENEMNVGYRKIFELNDDILRTVNESTRPAAAAASAAAAATSKTAAIKEAAGRAAASGSDAAAAATGGSIDVLADEARNKVIQSWVQLQQQVNLIFDSEKTGSALAKVDTVGIKQLLEKKQGLFRKHMMGKRVNFAARSVISPDPYLHTKEIGVPEIFAKVLTYPQPVTPYNVEEMRQAVINGPDVHPGANSVIDGRGRRTDLTRLSLAQRTAIAKTLISDASDSAPAAPSSIGVEKDLKSHLAGDAGPKVVLRHLRSGDVLLVNRQPTLHKPSMMSHVARVLYGESTIRMHYANCNSYNADFDGDEINLHFPQNELARVEAYDICNNDNQYVVPTSGNPLRGLIQDHVVAGVRLSQRDAFLNREFFQQFFYLGVSDSGLDAPLTTPVPTILKPRVLWTGKQVVSSVLSFVTHGRPALNLNPVKAKVPGSSWGKAAEEDGYVVIRENELVQGVIDKAQFGASKYGLVHAVFELYGGKTAGDLLTILARLFTRVLQYDGFTCGMDDMLLLPAADQRRRELIQDSAIAGITAAAECAGLSGLRKEDLTDTNAVHLALQRFFRDTPNAGELLDGAVKTALNQCTSSIIQACLPGGQRVPFPRNNMAMMTLSGAKGSMVNHSQISCLLGQQELEGRRVPVTQSGKTLPSFPKYDPLPRAGGYISQRFFTGIRPQEYYFHAMAGREGLVDTAVKTSRSGYLQRCLVKHLESLRVEYDHTVRSSDGSVVQFHYGEDAVDVTKSSYLNNLSFLAENYKPVVHKLDPTQAMALLDCDAAEQYVGERKALSEHIATLKAANNKEFDKEERTLRGDRAAGVAPADAAKQAKIALKRQTRFEALAEVEAKYAAMVPVEAKYAPGATLGAVAERFYTSVDEYVAKDPDATFRQAARAQEAAERALLALEARHTQTAAQAEAAALQVGNGNAGAAELLARLRAHAAAEQQQIQQLRAVTVNAMTPDKFAYLMNLNFANCLAPPGENVGVLAAQSVGEPSTQMTLNTFHLAGHGGANVTLGIPRLREIIMTASDHMSTPIMEIPLIPGSTAEQAELLAAKLDCITLAECVTRIDVRQSIGRQPGSREYAIRVSLKDLTGEWASKKLLTYRQIIRTVSTQLALKLNGVVRQKLRAAVARAATGVTQMTVQNTLRDAVDGAEGAGGAMDDDLASAQERRSAKQAEEGVKDSKRSKKGQEHVSYDDDDEEEEEEEDDADSDAEGSSKGKKKGGKKAASKDGEEADGSDSSDSDSDASGSDSDGDEEDGDESKSSARKSKKAARPSAAAEVDQSIRTFITMMAPQWNRHTYIDKVVFDVPETASGAEDDATAPGWFEVRVVTEPGQPKLLMLSLVEKVIAQCLVRQTKGITKAVVLERSVKGVKERYVQTAGVNFRAAVAHPEADASRLKCNDIWALLRTYGVEAARAAIKEEISGVFAVYGIGVDPRHLLLIADYMTFWGSYTPMNRMGMEQHVSVLQKATFETSLKFVIDACLRGDTDDCRSPSTAIVLGKPIPSGTSAFGLLQPITGF